MNKLFHPSNNKNNATSSEEIVALTIEKCDQEKHDMQKQYEKQIQSLENQAHGTRMVMQAMVLVARTKPDEFFTLLHEEGKQWDVTDLKFVAASIQQRLLDLKAKLASHKKHTDDDDASEPSTAQRLYAYVMMDPRAEKQIMIQVIGELHKELAVLDEIVASIWQDKENLLTSQNIASSTGIQVGRVDKTSEGGDENSTTPTVTTDADE